MSYVQGEDRGQAPLLPATIEDYVTADASVRVADGVDADLSKYFDTIPHARLLRCVARRIVDGEVLWLIKLWLVAH